MNYLSRVLNRRRVLEIHCWGGLGSQLFAWAVVEELLARSINRKLVLVLHTSGVTKRESELDALSKFVSIVQVSDYKEHSREVSREPKLLVFIALILKRLLKRLLQAVGVIRFNEGPIRIFPWTLQLRGHYSKREIDRQVIASMFTRFTDTGLLLGNHENRRGGLAIHYRLGDLLSLDSKSYIPPSEVLRGIELANKSDFTLDKHIDVYSDTPERALNMLKEISPGFIFKGYSLSPWKTISELIKYRHFLATNSKIGIWVALFRSLDSEDGTTLIPVQLKDDLKKLLDSEDSRKKITFY